MSKAFDEQRLTELIAKGKGAKALEELVALAKTDSSKLTTADRERILLLSSRFFENRQRLATGTVGEAEHRVEQTRINQAILQWMRDTPPIPPIPPTSMPSKSKALLRKAIVPLILLFTIIGVALSYFQQDPKLNEGQELIQQQLNELAWGKDQPALMAKIQQSFTRPVLIRVNWENSGNYSQYVLEDYLVDLDIIKTKDLIAITNWVDNPANASIILELIHHRHD